MAHAQFTAGQIWPLVSRAGEVEVTDASGNDGSNIAKLYALFKLMMDAGGGSDSMVTIDGDEAAALLRHGTDFPAERALKQQRGA